MLAAPVWAQPVLVEDGNIRLNSSDSNFGGLSGLSVTDDGLHFVAISDRGHFVTGDIIRDGGRLAEAVITAVLPINDSKGNPLDGRNIDAEGLAVLSDGSLLISFESNSRVMRHADLTSAPTFLPSTEAFGTLQSNSGLEALAVDAAGVVFAIPERSGALDRPFPVYRLIDGIWDERITVPRRGDYLVTGADIDEQFLYVLERYYKPLGGFQTRVRRFEIAGDVLVDEQVLLESRLGQYDNMEGIDVWHDAAGQTRIVLISDDNFRFYQRNQMVEFVLEG